MNAKLNLKSPAIVATLRACPSHHASVSRERFIEGWAELCREDVTPFIKPTVPVMAALVLHDDRFAALLIRPHPAVAVELLNSTMHSEPAYSKDGAGTSFAAPKVAHIAAHTRCRDRSGRSPAPLT